jgi:KDO2-lipid IV(A) lauroyltransferase
MRRRRLKLLFDAAIGAGAVGLLRTIKLTDRRRTANVAGALMRKIGPLFKEHRIGRNSLRAAFPEKSDAEIGDILAGVWDNLGRIAIEFAHLNEFHVAGLGPPTPDDIGYSPQTAERAQRIQAGGKPIIAFAAHTANWELPALCSKLIGFQSAVLYRRPNIRPVSDLIVKLRAPLMGELVANGLDAPIRLARQLQAGVHVGMLVDQFFFKGVEVNFFGRTCMANPLAALLARQTECPLHGLRVVRLADKNSFSIEITEAIEPARDADGRVDIQGTTQRITAVIEGWIREHPEQWLWLHRRWRRLDGRWD